MPYPFGWQPKPQLAGAPLLPYYYWLLLCLQHYIMYISHVPPITYPRIPPLLAEVLAANRRDKDLALRFRGLSLYLSFVRPISSSVAQPALVYTAYQNSDYDPFLGIPDRTFKALLQGVIGFCPLNGQVSVGLQGSCILFCILHP
jgi:hypothetical protein